jgi:hypothetical protein
MTNDRLVAATSERLACSVAQAVFPLKAATAFARQATAGPSVICHYRHEYQATDSPSYKATPFLW